MERVIPIAVAVVDQSGVAHEAGLAVRDDAIAVSPDRFEGAGGGKRLGIGVADRRRQELEIVACFDVVAEGFDRPEADVAVTMGLLNKSEGRKHEPLGPAAGDRGVMTIWILLLENRREQPADDGEFAGGEQPLDGPLADIAHAPSGAAVLFEAVRGGEVDDGVVREPRKDLVNARNAGVNAEFESNGRGGELRVVAALRELGAGGGNDFWQG